MVDPVWTVCITFPELHKGEKQIFLTLTPTFMCSFGILRYTWTSKCGYRKKVNLELCEAGFSLWCSFAHFFHCGLFICSVLSMCSFHQCLLKRVHKLWLLCWLSGLNETHPRSHFFQLLAYSRPSVFIYLPSTWMFYSTQIYSKFPSGLF